MKTKILVQGIGGYFQIYADLVVDGNQFCVKTADPLPTAVCGFGNTVNDAVKAFKDALMTDTVKGKPEAAKAEYTVEVSDTEQTGFMFRLVCGDRATAWGKYHDVLMLDDKAAMTEYYAPVNCALVPLPLARAMKFFAVQEK